MNQKTIADRLALIIGILLIIEGIWEFFSPVVFVVLTGNVTHGIIHIVLGLIGAWTGWNARARGFCIFLGLLLIAVGILWFIPAGNELVVRLLNVNQAVACVNLIVGAILLIAGFASRARAGG
jgi:hypothetical protein